MIVTHPCASRSQQTHRLHPTLTLAPVVRCPAGFESPWDSGYYELFPLPDLRLGTNYVAKLSEMCPVPAEALEGHRVACLSQDGLEALFHRLAMNAIRFPKIPAHFSTEAQRLTRETDLWEIWTRGQGTEDGFQDWLNEPFSGQSHEDERGEVIQGSARPNGQSRREALAWTSDEVEEELREHVGPILSEYDRD